MLRFLTAVAVLCCSVVNGAEPSSDAQRSSDVKPLLTKPGKLLFSEDLTEVPHERDKRNKVRRGNWQSGMGKWEIKDGVLVGAERPEDHHGAMLTKQGLPFHNAVVQVSFRLDGAKGITLDANSHALGRILAASITNTSLKLSASLSGGDRMEVLDTVPLKLEPGTWHTLLLEMQGPEVVASIDGREAAFGAYERVDSDKTSVQFRVGGESAALKNLTVHEASASDDWEATKTKLLAERKTKQ